VGTSRREPDVRAHGHVAVYARDARWRHAVARTLAASGHSRHEAATPAEIRRLLQGQRFDVLALKVRDEADAAEVVRALDGVRLPHHGILAGDANAVSAVFGPARAGTFRYVPGRPTGQEVCRLVDVSLSAGEGDEGPAEHNGDGPFEEVDLEEAIEGAAAMVYALARRRGLRFSSAVEGPIERAVGNAAVLRRVFATLLRLIVGQAPRGARVSVQARAGRDEWTVRIGAAGRSMQAGAPLAEAIREQQRTLTAVSEAVQSQGGLLWAELGGRGALAFCLTLPLPPEVYTAGAH
jgi:hypothetical protein